MGFFAIGKKLRMNSFVVVMLQSERDITDKIHLECSWQKPVEMQERVTRHIYIHEIDTIVGVEVACIGL